LVIDDEPNMVRFVSRALTRQGFGVDTAGDGLRGLHMAEDGKYDLMLVDLLLPTLDGITLMREALRREPDQRMIVMSAIADVDTKVRCLEMGALDYLVKPIQLGELVARIRSRLRQATSALQPERTLRVGTVELDLSRRMVDTGLGRCSLSTREFLLLEHLMRHPTVVCTRDELLERVWGYTFDPGTNVVDVYVARLRAKVGTRAIETVRGVGYSFVGS
jgi:two-component system copper resistance phosphate regulon response regulator CusR